MDRQQCIRVKYRGKSRNSTITLLVNITDIAHELNVSIFVLVTFLKIALHREIQRDVVCKMWYSIRGKYTAECLQKHLNYFIDNYVKCRLCTSTETDLVRMHGKKMVVLKCRICLRHYFVLSHPFNPVIVKYLPRYDDDGDKENIDEVILFRMGGKTNNVYPFFFSWTRSNGVKFSPNISPNTFNRVYYCSRAIIKPPS